VFVDEWRSVLVAVDGVVDNKKLRGSLLSGTMVDEVVVAWLWLVEQHSTKLSDVWKKTLCVGRCYRFLHLNRQSLLLPEKKTFVAL
jgi:hypothetical protein